MHQKEAYIPHRHKVSNVGKGESYIPWIHIFLDSTLILSDLPNLPLEYFYFSETYICAIYQIPW